MEFSVLMTVYEKEKPYNLRKSLLTSYSQTIKPTEIVLVCDGELTQELYDEIDQIKSEIPILQVYQLDTNMGSGPASRFGVEKCNTDLIARMDSDDYSKETRFEKQIKAFEENPNLIMVGTNILEKNTEFTALKTVPERTKEIREYSKFRNPFNNPSSMMKKEYILKVGNYRKFRYLEDYDLTMRLIHDNPTKDFLNIQEPLVIMQTDNSSYLRRGGLLYVKTEFFLQTDFYKRGYITKVELCRNIFIRNIVRVLPNSMRKLIYKKKMRESVEVKSQK
ncbi:glycosyltransferase [uncultured Gemella sp.]|uniref:glycosyltransferase n=1 Tax=uncultured Gemella sp. TaxID=254352 RepID=UPI0025F826DA|nr:glycosyltransferase [uncultured Gemella sp.]